MAVRFADFSVMPISVDCGERRRDLRVLGLDSTVGHTPFGRSWLFDALDLGTAWTVLGGLIWIASGLLIIAAGLGYLDVPGVQVVWALLALLGGVLGLIAVALFFHPLYLAAMVINLVLVVWAWNRLAATA